MELFLAQKDIDVNVLDPWGCTPLHQAVKSGRVEIVKLLLNHSGITDVNARDTEGFYPITHAVSKEMMELLLSNPDIDVNVLDPEDRTPLHIAVISGRVEIVELLLSHSGTNDVNTKYAYGLHPINHAAVINTPKGIELLFEHPSINVNAQGPKGHTALNKAARYGKVEIVKLLLNYNAEPNIRELVGGETPLHKAAYYYQMNNNRDDCLEVIKLLVKGGANLGAMNYGRPGDQNDGKSPIDFLPAGVPNEVLDVCVVRVSRVEEEDGKVKDGVKLINPFHQPQIHISDRRSGLRRNLVPQNRCRIKNKSDEPRCRG